MEDPPSSPERAKSVITYAGRVKRARTSTNYAEDGSDSDSNEADNAKPDSHAGKSSGSKGNNSKSSVKPPNKDFDFRLPETPLKRFGSISGDVHEAEDAPGKDATPNSTKKPISFTKPLSKRSTMADAEHSVTGSATKVRRSEAERLQYFKDQPDCGTIEEHRVLCKRCCKMVNLGRKQTYTVRPWETHRMRCDQKSPREADSMREEEEEEEEEIEEEDDAASTVAPSLTQSEMSTRRTEEERKSFLLEDSRAETVKPEEVLCRKCQKWIKLSKTINYSLSNWNAHQRRCSDAMPSSRVTAAERKLRIVNDSQAKAFDARHVECAICDQNIALKGETEYDLTCWEEHKSQCPKPSPGQSSKPSSRSQRASKSRLSTPASVESNTPSGSNPPPSSASTDNTLVAAPPVAPSRGKKREREDSEEETAPIALDSDVRPSNRPRNEKYVAPDMEPPGLYGLFMLPFQAFSTGLRGGTWRF